MNTVNEDARILDHGYLRLVESWGSDERIIEAARMSTQKGFEGWGGDPCPACLGAGRISQRDFLFRTFEFNEEAREKCVCKGSGKTSGDEKLLSFLWKNNHATPFEMAGMTIEVQAPIMVFREWHRHRTQSYNEMSARYTPLPDLSYVPTVERLLLNSKTNKQAGVVAGADELSEGVAAELMAEERAFNEAAERFYQKKLKAGVPKELARTHLGVSRISRMRASANLRNWLGFLTLRADVKAQWEIRQYAFALAGLVKEAFPRTYRLWEGK
jgi:thymidylate synthase (FAD)